MDKEKWLNFKDIKPINKRRKPEFKYPDGEILQGEIIDEIRVDNKTINENSTGKNYINLVQKIKLSNGNEAFRFCYYYIQLDNDKPRWIFGQYALVLEMEEYNKIIEKMREKGWI